MCKGLHLVQVFGPPKGCAQVSSRRSTLGDTWRGGKRGWCTFHWQRQGEGCTSKGLGAMVEGGKDGWLILYLVHRNGLGGLLHGLWGLFPALCTRILDRGMCKKPWASLLPTSTNLLREMERGSGIPSHLPNPRFGKMVHISSPGKKIYSAEIIIVHGHGGAHVP